MGMKEVLQSIKKAEDDAAEALKSASEESAKILSDARTKASKSYKRLPMIHLQIQPKPLKMHAQVLVRKQRPFTAKAKQR